MFVFMRLLSFNEPLQDKPKGLNESPDGKQTLPASLVGGCHARRRALASTLTRTCYHSRYLMKTPLT